MVPTLQSDEIRKRIFDMFYWDVRVDYANIGVELHDGTALLTGSVPSASARLAAEKDALNVRGVRSVDNRLKVHFTGDIPLPSDAEIESRVAQVIRWNSNVDERRISITANAGLVTLTGTVHSYYQKVHAAELATDIIGVFAVDNRLAVVPTRSTTDEEVGNDIVATLKNNLGRDADSLTVMVKDGIAALTGYVPDQLAFNAAQNLVSHVRGVVDVNNLLITGEPVK
jgi:osmotically-inducible protein OsmY